MIRACVGILKHPAFRRKEKVKYMKQILSDFIRVINESSPNKDTMVYSLVFTLCMAVVMALTYRLIHTALSYNARFNVNLMMMAFLSNVLLLLLQDLSLIHI